MFWKRSEDSWEKYQELVHAIAPKGWPELIERRLQELQPRLESAGIYFEAEVISEMLNTLVENFPKGFEYESFTDEVQTSFREEVHSSIFALQRRGRALGTAGQFVQELSLPTKDDRYTYSYATPEMPVQLRTDRLIVGYRSFPLSRKAKARVSRGSYTTDASMIFSDLDWVQTFKWSSYDVQNTIEKYLHFAEVFNMVARDFPRQTPFVSRTDSSSGGSSGRLSIYRSQEINLIRQALSENRIYEEDATAMLRSLTPTFSENRASFENLYLTLKSRLHVE